MIVTVTQPVQARISTSGIGPAERVSTVGIQGPAGAGNVLYDNVSTPPSLPLAVLAYSTLSNNLFFGTPAGVVKVGGNSDVVKLAASTHLATPGSLVQRDNNGSAKFNNIEVNSVTLNGNVSSTSQITSFCTSSTNETINIGSTAASTVVLSAVKIKSSLTDALKIVDQNDATIFNIAQNGDATLKNINATSAVIANNLSVTQNITASGISSTIGTINTLTSASGTITALTANTITCNSGLSAGATTLLSLTVNGASQLRGDVNGLTVLNAKSNLTNFVINGNNNTLRIRTTIDNINNLAAGEGELYLNQGKLYYKEANGSIRTFISTDADSNMSIGNIILEGVLKLDTSTSIGGIASQEHIIDSFPISDYRSAKYMVQVSSGTQYQSSEVLVVHNGTESYLTEYGFVQTNGTLCNVETRIEGGMVKLVSYGNYNGLTYQVTRQAIAI
jgi:hypothetical protein